MIRTVTHLKLLYFKCTKLNCLSHPIKFVNFGNSQLSNLLNTYCRMDTYFYVKPCLIDLRLSEVLTSRQLSYFETLLLPTKEVSFIRKKLTYFASKETTESSSGLGRRNPGQSSKMRPRLRRWRRWETKKLDKVLFSTFSSFRNNKPISFSLFFCPKQIDEIYDSDGKWKLFRRHKNI